MSDSALGERILQHLIDISASKCTITEEEIAAEPNDTTRDLLAGLLTLHEELEYRQQQRQQTVEKLQDLTSKLEHRVAVQAQAILVLSTPVIEVVPGILILPLIGNVDTVRAQQIMEQSLSAVVEHEASVFIIDVTGVTAIDHEVTAHLLNTVDAVRLLGARAILSGISPANAMALVKLGVDIEKIQPHGSLQGALRSALTMTKRVIASTDAIAKRSVLPNARR